MSVLHATTPTLNQAEFDAKAIGQNLERMLRIDIDAKWVNKDAPAAIERLEQLEKSFSDLIKKARLALSKAHDLQPLNQPRFDRISGNVINAILRRIGKGSLDIDSIAKELNMSKRTLQRRLNDRQIRFAQLRDQIRFHYATKLLIESRNSIEQISEYLDFSNRTSFTNAFKRWTNLSPSTFRKTVRDYT